MMTEEKLLEKIKQEALKLLAEEKMTNWKTILAQPMAYIACEKYGLTPTETAKLLGKDNSTICRNLKRAKKNLLNE